MLLYSWFYLDLRTLTLLEQKWPVWFGWTQELLVMFLKQ